MDTIPAVSSSEDHLKAAFAAALLKHPATLEGRFAAAQTVTGDTGKALYMANKWPDDPFVIAEQKRLVAKADNGELDFIGTKAEYARELLEYARSAWDGEVKHKFYKLYGEVRGWVGAKVDTQVNVQFNQNKVMIVRDLGSDAEWEAKARNQQRALIDVSTSKH